MTRSTAVTLSLLLFGSLWAALAVWAARRTHHAADFLLANRRVGTWLTALSYGANATSATMVLVFVAAAFQWGLAAAWIWPACLFGYAVNTLFIAPRLRVLSIAQGSFTLVQVLSADAGDRMQKLVVRCACFIALTLLLLQTGAQLRLMSDVLSELGFGIDGAIASITLALTLYLLVGGHWASSASDASHAAVLLLVVAFLPLPAMIAGGGFSELRNGFAALGPQASDFFDGKSGVVAVALVCGIFGIGLASTGQPHAVNRFMAARDEATLGVARWIAMLWMALLLAVALLCGWAAKVLYAGLEHPQQALFALGSRLLPAPAAAFISVALLATILCSVGSQYLVAAAGLSADLKRPTSPLSLPWLRVALVAFAVGAACFARFGSPAFLEYTLFSFTALGASFGPLLLVRLSGKRVRPGSTLGAMWAGFTLTLLLHLLPDAPGDFLERVLPFVASLGIALSGGERRRNPDRADRAQETVHDRVPI